MDLNGDIDTDTNINVNVYLNSKYSYTIIHIPSYIYHYTYTIIHIPFYMYHDTYIVIQMPLWLISLPIVCRTCYCVRMGRMRSCIDIAMATWRNAHASKIKIKRLCTAHDDEWTSENLSCVTDENHWHPLGRVRGGKLTGQRNSRWDEKFERFDCKTGFVWTLMHR